MDTNAAAATFGSDTMLRMLSGSGSHTGVHKQIEHEFFF